MANSELQLSWIERQSDQSLQLIVNLDLYPLEALFRVCYWFTDRCYLFLDRPEHSSSVTVHFAKKTSETDLSTIAGEFSNELINQRCRFDIAEETRAIRELIVAQAFTEADLLDRAEANADYHQDPRGIAE